MTGNEYYGDVVVETDVFSEILMRNDGDDLMVEVTLSTIFVACNDVAGMGSVADVDDVLGWENDGMTNAVGGCAVCAAATVNANVTVSWMSVGVGGILIGPPGNAVMTEMNRVWQAMVTLSPMKTLSFHHNPMDHSTWS